MKTFAPGKLVLTGAYAVLEGAPSIAVATTRGAYADSTRAADMVSPEVRAALGDAVAPHVDPSAMFEGDRKLGLGASAAILVASIAARDEGADLADAAVRARIFERARAAHAKAQGGGSGVDVAASVYGGAIRYTMGEPTKRVRLPEGLQIHVFACSTSARTSELRGAVDRLASTDARGHRACLDELGALAHEGARAVDSANAAGFVDVLRRTARSLANLGAAAGVGIVPSGFGDLEALAAAESASFSVSGAGGGDVAVHVGPARPTATFVERARALGLTTLDVGIDDDGVRLVTSSVFRTHASSNGGASFSRPRTT